MGGMGVRLDPHALSCLPDARLHECDIHRAAMCGPNDREDQEMSPNHKSKFVHALPADLPYGWAWPARPSTRGYWMMTYQYPNGYTANRAVHLCVAEYEGIPLIGCHWCGDTRLSTEYVIDHVDGDKGNNLPYNLVRSCNSCNRLKGAQWWGPGYMTRTQYERSDHADTHTCVDRRMCDMGVSDGDEEDACAGLP